MNDRALATTAPGGAVAGLQQPSGMAAIAAMSDADFAANLQMLTTSQERVRMIQSALMHEGRDYGTIPGTKKPTLLKPGAEILTLAYGFVARITTQEVPGDGITTPLIRYDATCVIHAGGWDGPVVAIAYGTCNNWELKYRYRGTSSGLVCPGCGKAGLVRTREKEAKGRLPARPAQYWHPTDARPDGGCNQNFALDDPNITNQTAVAEKIENPDPYEQANTILKIADKRAHVAGILRATGTSGLFTVDEEESDKKETPAARSRREFTEWVAESGLDPKEVQALGEKIYPGRNLRQLEVWERTAWRSLAERDILYADPDDPRTDAAAGPDAKPVGPQGAPQAAAQPEGAPMTEAQRTEAREAIRADVKGGKSADEVAAGIREREQAAPAAARMFTAEELADLDVDAQAATAR